MRRACPRALAVLDDADREPEKAVHRTHSVGIENYLPSVRHVPAALRLPKNLMADEILGIYRAPIGVVELSEVRFLERRYVGITIADRRALDGRRTPARGCVQSFAELEEELGMRDRTTSEEA